jgi:hypothetical protein
VHDQEDAREDLNHKDQQGQGTKNVEKVEVFGRVVLAHVLFEELGQREPVVNPVQGFVSHWRIGGDVFEFSHGVYL